MQGDAAKACAHLDVDDEELMDYGNQLRRSIFEAYSGILQGFKNAKAVVMMSDESVTKAAVAVMGDLADALGPNTKILFKH
ncbi:hypothetical protein QYF36_000898 [Acer negundo]|nr:hypothetical protein QYF36_000898 [Acer negundo]